MSSRLSTSRCGRGGLQAGVGLAILLAATTIAHADIKLSGQFSDHMVLQRQMPVPIWGSADPGEKVTVTLTGAKGVKPVSATTGADGKWNVSLPALSAGGPYTLDIAGKNKIDIADVLVGEVWLCSGQSNMEFTLDRATNGPADAAAANDPQMRMCIVAQTMARQPADTVKATWEATTPDTAPKMSAVAFYFGRELRKKLGVPVGLIDDSMGWTPAESWVSREALSADPGLKHSIVDRWDFWRDQYPKALALYNTNLAAWQTADDAAKAAGTAEPAKPKPPTSDEFSHRASCLYNGMIAPIIPYAMRGAIWWQGETNVERAYQYRTLFPVLIKDWRARWHEGNFPFLFVQLAAVGNWPMKPEEARWAELREAQAITAATVPDTAMVVALDVGLPDNVHPPHKEIIGHRLALAADSVAYHGASAYAGPVFVGATFDGPLAVVKFQSVDKGLASSDGKPLIGFVLAGEDKKFYPASAVMTKDSVVVSCADVPHPISVRYAWLDFPQGNLVDSNGLPASPFRSDNWPGITVGYDKMYYDQNGIDDVTMVQK